MVEILTEEEAARNNHAAFLGSRKAVSEKYPSGWYVGFYECKLVAAAESQTELEQMILLMGIDSSEVLVVPAHQGDDFLWII